MRKEGLVFIVALLLFGVSVFAEVVSDNSAEIQISGCTDYDLDKPLADQMVGFAKIGECLGDAYCASHNNLQNAFDVDDACTKGTGVVSGNAQDICCNLAENMCTDVGTPSGKFRCVARTKDCTKYTIDTECEANQCYWDTNRVVCIPFSKGCYDYTIAGDCTGDIQNVSKNDPNCKYGEFQVGGIPYIVSRDTCKCVWDAQVGAGGASNCTLVYNVTTAYGDGSSYSLCDFRFNITEECEEGDRGFEKYIYIADYNDNLMSVSGLLPSDVGCANRTGQRRCGVDVVKVPFFDFINVILVVLSVFMIYCFRTKFSFWYK